MRIQTLFSYTFGLILAAICHTANAQSTVSSPPTTDSVFINGRVIDETKEGMIGAIVDLKTDSRILSVTSTNEDGYFHLYCPPAFLLNTFVRVTYQSYKTKEIQLKSFKKPYLIEMELDATGFNCPVSNCIYRIPLIDPWGPTQRSFNSYEIEKMAR